MSSKFLRLLAVMLAAVIASAALSATVSRGEAGALLVPRQVTAL